MGTYIYTKSRQNNFRKAARLTGLGLAIIGVIFGIYTFYPLLSWQLYLKPALASNEIASPIPKTAMMTPDTIASLLRNSLNNGDWLPGYNTTEVSATNTAYSLSIPKLKITDAEVSTIDTDISRHLVHFPGTALPPGEGNAVIFGHSTLPQLYEENNYKTIFAKIHNMTIGDAIVVKINNNEYKYLITSITIVEADDTSYLSQDEERNLLTIVTCTPPGTTWKRLILKSRLEQISNT